MDTDYFKVKQPEWIATDMPICDIKTFSISLQHMDVSSYNIKIKSINVYFHGREYLLLWSR